jgi:hypothetical protein
MRRSLVIVIFVGALVFGGMLFFVLRIRPTSTGGVQTWGISTSPEPAATFSPQATASDAPSTPSSDASGSASFPFSSSTPASVQPGISTTPFETLLKPLFIASSSTAMGTPNSGDFLTQSSYLFAPLATPTPQIQRGTPLQKALHEYGNAAGSVIKSFEATHTDETDILTAQAKDRKNAQKSAALRNLAQDLSGIGTDLLAIENVPENARAANQALGESYVDAGKLLGGIADAGADDTSLLEAIKAYNASAETLTRRYIALVNLFALSDVEFGPSEAGNAFVFSGGGAVR